MEAPMKYVCVAMFLAMLSIVGFNGVDAHYGPCGKHELEKEAEKLAPCKRAAQDIYAPVPQACCAVVEKKLKNPGCLCALMFTQRAKNAGFKPYIAVTLPKRCNLPVHPVGHKCGAYPLV